MWAQLVSTDHSPPSCGGLAAPGSRTAPLASGLDACLLSPTVPPLCASPRPDLHRSRTHILSWAVDQAVSLLAAGVTGGSKPPGCVCVWRNPAAPPQAWFPSNTMNLLTLFPLSASPLIITGKGTVWNLFLGKPFRHCDVTSDVYPCEPEVAQPAS